MAPLGILTALVSVIRVSGQPWLRAFIGRSQERPGDAELELLSCTSETPSELWNDNSISRVFGKPKILEIVSLGLGEKAAFRPSEDGDDLEAPNYTANIDRPFEH